MTRQRIHVTLIALICLSVLGAALYWRTLAATVCVNVASVQLSRALVGEAGTDTLRSAEDWYGRALTIHPHDQRAQRSLVRIALERGESVESLGITRTDIEQRSDLLALFHLGMLDWSQGEQEQAITLWQRVPMSSLYFCKRGMLAFRAGEIEAALADYQTSLAIDPEPTLAKRAMYADLRNHYLQLGHPDEALHWCEIAVQVDPSAWNWINLGRAHLAQGDLDAALAALQEAEQQQPSFYQLHFYLGRAFEKQGDLVQALAAYRQAADLEPKAIEVLWGLGRMSEALGDAEEAYCAYQRIEQLTSNPQQAAQARNSRERLGLAEPIACEERP